MILLVSKMVKQKVAVLKLYYVQIESSNSVSSLVIGYNILFNTVVSEKLMFLKYLHSELPYLMTLLSLFEVMRRLALFGCGQHAFVINWC